MLNFDFWIRTLVHTASRRKLTLNVTATEIPHRIKVEPLANKITMLQIHYKSYPPSKLIWNKGSATDYLAAPVVSMLE